MRAPKSTQEVAALLPHAGAMCLLDEVACWDETHVVCRSASHRRRPHPLCREGHLSSIHLLEYAAQAAGVHGGLLSGADALSAMYLTSVRDFQLNVASLDEVAADLHIDAERLLSLGDGVLYGFQVCAAGELLASGRLGVMPGAGGAT
jgi:predicted hotdog family 3-hydroxylacyl-ACP dehydratase